MVLLKYATYHWAIVEVLSQVTTDFILTTLRVASLPQTKRRLVYLSTSASVVCPFSAKGITYICSDGLY